MAWRRVLVPLVAVGIAYLSFGVGLVLVAVLKDPEYQHVQDLQTGVYTLAWGLFALVAMVVSLTSLALIAWNVRWFMKLGVLVLNLPVVAAAAGAVVVSIWSFQNYSAGYAAYDAAQQACGGPPVIVATGFGGGYMVPTSFDYERLRYASHAHILFFNNNYVFYCTEEEAIAQGYHRLP